MNAVPPPLSMRRRATLIVTALLFLSLFPLMMPNGGAEVSARNSESGIIALEKHIFWSDEYFTATFEFDGLTIGQSYTIYWDITVGNGSGQVHPTIDSGNIAFSATSISLDVEFSRLHFANDSIAYNLVATLNSTQGGNTGLVMAAPFAVFSRTIAPMFGDLVVFGDSLSDTGNSKSNFNTPESPPYWFGRYSNGRNWVDNTHSWLSITTTAGDGPRNGNNRAFGGASSGGGSSFVIIPNVGKQVDDWDANHNFASNDAAAIWAGGNDILNYGETSAQTVIDNIEDNSDQLISAGARYLILFELPPLEKTPSAQEDNSASENQDMHELVVEFNAKLSVLANDLAQSNGITVNVIPIWQVFEMTYWSGEHFAVTNVTHPACDHDGALCDRNDPIASNADEYIFFDKIHPTLTTHSVISAIIQTEIGIPDYDGDGVADDVDDCLNTLPETPVTENGCEVPPPDMDGDGVLNDDDYCPDTPTNETVNADGCAESQLDDDGDGLTNDVDQCPGTPEGEEVDTNGCGWSQIDDDGDAVLNGIDQCPDSDVALAVDLNGCAANQKDDDDDDVTNDLDLCPGTWAGSMVDADGCALYQRDTDGDGVMDHKDECSATPMGDSVDAVGCGSTQKDDDEDGVMNAYDECPTTPTGESVNAVGCALMELDSDHDGFSDAVDDCPDTSYGADTDGDGCADEQLDGDGDGFNDRDDLCPSTSGESGGCPILTLSVVAPIYGSQHYRGSNITFQILIRCSSGCPMQLTQTSREGNFSAPAVVNASNGTYQWTLEVPGDSLYQRVNLDLTLTSGISIITTTHFIMLGETPVDDDTSTGDSTSTDEADAKSASGDRVNSNIIAVGLLLAILFILITLYRQQPPAKPLLSEEEKWMEQTTLVTTTGLGSEVFGDGQNLP